MSSKDHHRERVRQLAERLGLTITLDDRGCFRIYGRNGFIDFRVKDLAEVSLDDLAPRRWA
jgi:hypothetical protein